MRGNKGKQLLTFVLKKAQTCDVIIGLVFACDKQLGRCRLVKFVLFVSIISLPFQKSTILVNGASKTIYRRDLREWASLPSP